MRRFLEFVVAETLQGRAAQIKEYAIAIEVFGKRPDYDPQTDSTVRTEATKLRARLARYYATEGVSDSLVISLPKGTYVPQFQERSCEPSAANGGSLSPAPSPRFRLRTPNRVLVAGSILIALAAGIWLFSWVQRQQTLSQLEAKADALMAAVSEDDWSGDSILRAMEYYRQMLSLDPKSISAYEGLAGGYVLLSDVFMAPREAMPKAELAATRASQLNPRSWRYHLSLGMVKLQFEWNWPSSRAEFQTAMNMDPNEPLPRHLYSWYLMSEGRFTEARAEIEHAESLAESDDFGHWELALCSYFSGQYEDAVEQARRAIAIQPKDYWPHLVLGWTLEQQGRVSDAISEMTIATRLTDTPQAIAALAHARALAGERVEADRLLQELSELSRRRYVSPYDVATVYAAYGDTEQTLTFLEKAYEERSGWLALWLKVDPKFNSVRIQPRFSSLLKRVGVPARTP